jgi:replicative DNA helicase
MPVQKLTDRMIQLRAKVNGQAFKTGKLSRDETERVITASSELGHASLYLRDHKSVRNTFPSIAAATRRIKDNGGLDVLLVDYVQLMRGPEQNRVEQISTITRGLKLLAMELEIVVIGLCQLNRAVENRAKDDARISDLKESGSLEQDADKVFLWGREMDSGPDLVPAWVIVGKNRAGGGGKVKLEYNNRIGCFVDRE